ncbi:cation diffusion facilitator family transporter [Cellulosilyticum ruminicola]|uniref:cation diffusion facilitator family transporter n=1 Tax=Cellulosilyticum ruminicola TaxID=425254 RepID=UPI000A73AB90|nr:cation diffusion facilitator family transporter [Cellulosilyticum ruminicola]
MGNAKEALELMNIESNKEVMDRDKKIIKTSIIGIVANVFLAVFKTVIGVMSNSIAIVMDAVNNISDAASSIITIVGTKLASKHADKKHPFGYGRVEYLSALIISLIVLYAGITSFIESAKSILSPELPKYSRVALVIIIVGVIVKILLGRYVKKHGEKYNSGSLINSGQDATLDSIISASTLVAALIYIIFGLSLEAWLGIIISVVIIKSGIVMIKDTLSQILGERADPELAKAIKKTVTSFKEVEGAYDLVLNNYGPDAYSGSIHIEVPDIFSADQLDELIRSITFEVYRKHYVYLTAIGVYSINTKDEYAVRIRENIRQIVLGIEHILEMHGFFVNKEKNTIRFDAVVSFDSPDRIATYRQVVDAVQKEYPDYIIQCAIDTDYSET